MPVDVLIASYGPQDETERWLHRSIRSILANAQNLGRVIVAGNPPSCLPDGVLKFPVPPMVARGSRYDNAVDCVLRAISEGIVSGPFLYAPTETELSQPTDLAAYPFYSRRPRIKSVADYIRENKGGAIITRYKLVLSDTRAALERNGYGSAETTGRFLTYIDPADAPEVKRIWLEEPHGEFGYDVSCLFGNIRAKRLALVPSLVTSPET